MVEEATNLLSSASSRNKTCLPCRTAVPNAPVSWRRHFITGCSSARAPSWGILVLLLLGYWSAVGQAEKLDHSARQYGGGVGEAGAGRGPAASNNVQSLTAAEKYLGKYGYLRCADQRAAGRRGSAGGPGLGVREAHAGPSGRFMAGGRLQETDDGLEACSPEEVHKATLKFQREFHLQVTGELDGVTKNKMSEPRCGNKDDDVIEEEEELVTPRPTTQTPTELPSENMNIPMYIPESRGKRAVDMALYGSQSRLVRMLGGAQEAHFTRVSYPAAATADMVDEDPRTRRRRSLEALKTRRKREASHESRISKRDVAALAEELEVLTRHKRSNLTSSGQTKFDKKKVVWSLNQLSEKMASSLQRDCIAVAFRIWAEVCDIYFAEQAEGDVTDVDISISFGKGTHLTCNRAFDGLGGETAHSWQVGDIHLDDDEDFVCPPLDNSDGTGGINLLRVLVHEIGHTIGLIHTDRDYSVMYAIYPNQNDTDNEVELCWEDRELIKGYYGECKGSFSTIFDYVKKQPDMSSVFYSYFFRDDHYWKYMNFENRTRYGDPVYIENKWPGVPAQDVQAFLHVWYWNDVAGEVSNYYFFKDNMVYVYDNVNENTTKTLTISEAFPAKQGQTEAVPSHIDSAFFDFRDKNIYFFKGSTVYVYDPKPAVPGCCERIAPLATEFPVADGHPQPTSVDSVFRSYSDQTMYFVSGDDLWSNADFEYALSLAMKNPPEPAPAHSNHLMYYGKIWMKWYNICDVEYSKT